MKTRLMTALPFVLAALVLDLALIQPNHPIAMTWGALRLFPLELPAIIFALLALSAGRGEHIFRFVLVAILTAIIALKTADLIMFSALNRGFNMITDLPLIASLFHLINGSFGTLAAIAAGIAAVLATVASAALLWWATGVWACAQLTGFKRATSGLAACLFATVAVGEIGQAMGKWTLPASPPGAAFTARVGVERALTVNQTLADLRSFRDAAARDEFADMDGLLDLIDRDVLIIYVESYGRTSFDTPLFAPTHLATLAAAETQLGDAGLAMASTFLTSPTSGGQSWLAHSTIANGLWIDNQTSYATALASGRQSLFHLAARSGFHAAAVMPQITLNWPEAATMGFDTILVAKDFGYKGEPFNWVTMPDQFNLHAMDRLLFAPAPRDPVFAQVVLVSSHAPWVPVPDLLEWDAMGDGTVFNPLIAAADPPAVVWADHDRVRDQYRRALDYSLQTVFSYVARHADDAPLIFVIGDHQAAGFVALDERHDVPMHVIGPRDLVDLVMDSGFHDGLIPPEDTPLRAMDTLRTHILRAYSSDLRAQSQ